MPLPMQDAAMLDAERQSPSVGGDENLPDAANRMDGGAGAAATDSGCGAISVLPCRLCWSCLGLELPCSR
jgi:hypothetical protein